MTDLVESNMKMICVTHELGVPTEWYTRWCSLTRNTLSNRHGQKSSTSNLKGEHRKLLPALKSVNDRGGDVFKIGKFFSEDYSDAVCEKYINLGFYSNSVRIKAELEKI